MLLPSDFNMEQLIAQHDLFLANAPLPLKGIFHPLGFPVQIVTNSDAVLDAASQSWRMFRQRFDCPPLTLHLGVSSDVDEASQLPPTPTCRIEHHLMSHVADAQNFIHCDLNAGFAFGWVTSQMVESVLYLRYHIIETAILSMIATLRAAPLHAACVSAHGQGILLCGDSGAGKSSLAFAGARAGWTFTCDDASYLLWGRSDRMVVGNCHQFRLRDSGPQLFPELEGRSITPRASGKPSIEIPTAELEGLATSELATVNSIIFLNRDRVRRPQLVEASRKEAHSWFSQFPYLHTATYDEQQGAICHLLKVPIYELRYTELDWAVDRLNTLALTGA